MRSASVGATSVAGTFRTAVTASQYATGVAPWFRGARACKALSHSERLLSKLSRLRCFTPKPSQKLTGAGLGRVVQTQDRCRHALRTVGMPWVLGAAGAIDELRDQSILAQRML